MHRILVSNAGGSIVLKSRATFLISSHLGGDNDLEVDVAKFDPGKVECSPLPYPRDATVLRACQSIVDQMRASKSEELFAQKNLHDKGLETPLPCTYGAPAEGTANTPTNLSATYIS